MIIRIVKMTFEKEKVEEFLTVFNASKHLIRNMEGCTHLELLSDVHAPNIYFTYSYWNNDSDLQNYRNSELFKMVWGKTKVLFADKAQAWTVVQKAVLE